MDSWRKFAPLLKMGRRNFFIFSASGKTLHFHLRKNWRRLPFNAVLNLSKIYPQKIADNETDI